MSGLNPCFGGILTSRIHVSVYSATVGRMSDTNAPMWTVRRVVASNMRSLRLERDWTQPQAIEAIAETLGTTWSVQTYNNAESSRHRLFSADELVAIALAFGVPLTRLFEPPEELPEGVLRSDLELLLAP